MVVYEFTKNLMLRFLYLQTTLNEQTNFTHFVVSFFYITLLTVIMKFYTCVH